MRFASGMFLARDSISLVVQQVHILVAHLIEVVFPLDAHSRDLHPVAVLPVAAGSGHLAQVDLRVKVGGKGIAVVAAVAVQNINGVNGVELVLFGVGAVSLGHAGSKPLPSRAVRPASSNFFA